MKDLKHIKGFNESEENLNISDVTKRFHKENRESINVNEMFEYLGKLIESGRGDYKMKIDVNEYYVNLKDIQTIDDDGTVNVL